MSDAPSLFSIGLLSDVQYADREPAGRCRYREALQHLSAAIDCFNAHELAGVAQLGDLVDSNEPAHLEATLAILAGCRHPLWHLMGNHDSKGQQDGDVVARQLGLGESGRYGERLHRDGWRVLAIDSLEISVEASPAGSGEREIAQRELAELEVAGEPCGQFWNGRAGEAQLAQLDALLSEADAAGERVLLLSHLPAHPDSASARHLCWNHAELRALFGRHPSVFAHCNGHDHHGGFATDAVSGIHYLTLPAVCDSVNGQGARAVAHFFPDRIDLEGWGRLASRALEGGRSI